MNTNAFFENNLCVVICEDLNEFKTCSNELINIIKKGDAFSGIILVNEIDNKVITKKYYQSLIFSGISVNEFNKDMYKTPKEQVDKIFELNIENSWFN